LAAAATLAPGAFVVLAGASFDGDVYGGIDESLVMRGTRSSFCASLVNSDAQEIVLKDAGGRPISSMTAFADLLPHDDGKSVERTSASAPDVAASWCFSRDDTGPTPGRVNGVVSAGCDE
jgi:hypothetical protein